jgi:two-component system sensor histidine kinase KdpD
VLYDRRTGEFYRDGPLDFEGLDQQLRDAALSGTSFSDAQANRMITAVHLGAEPIASLAVQGIRMPDFVLQGIANLVAIGLERARAQDLAQEMEPAQRSEQLRTTLIDAMAHELKTPLTLIKSATSAVLAGPDRLSDATTEQLTIADEEAEHLRELLDTALEIARLDTAHIDVHPEISNIGTIVREVVASMRTEIEDRPLEIIVDGGMPLIAVDRRLVKLAVKQLVNNAVKYAPPDLPLAIRVRHSEGMVTVDVTDHGPGISDDDQGRIFERFYRGPSVLNRIPGSGLGLNIAYRIAHAHQGELAVKSRPGETTFTMRLPVGHAGSGNN